MSHPSSLYLDLLARRAPEPIGSRPDRLTRRSPFKELLAPPIHQVTD
uniref:Uncharacterized protein n=1 Tax=Peronospora matthiolae TaxID=2874970 RepID=A0AAV1TPV7_9STRA